MSDEETAKDALTRILYSKIDAGLYKRDAYEIVDAIEAMITEQMAEMLELLSSRFEALKEPSPNTANAGTTTATQADKADIQPG